MSLTGQNCRLWVLITALIGGLDLPFHAAETTAQAETQAPKPLEIFLLLPEPRAMRSTNSLKPAGAEKTVFSPARETRESPFLEVYPSADLKALGISAETFAERAATHADRLIQGLQPDWVRDEKGRIAYAVFRGERPIYACLLHAPTLPKLFEKAFGSEIWLAAPDRNSLYVFPADPERLAEFTADLMQRYESDAYSASCEIFSWKAGQKTPVVVGTFAD